MNKEEIILLKNQSMMMENYYITYDKINSKTLTEDELDGLFDSFLCLEQELMEEQNIVPVKENDKKKKKSSQDSAAKGFIAGSVGTAAAIGASKASKDAFNAMIKNKQKEQVNKAQLTATKYAIAGSAIAGIGALLQKLLTKRKYYIQKGMDTSSLDKRISELRRKKRG